MYVFRGFFVRQICTQIMSTKLNYATNVHENEMICRVGRGCDKGGDSTSTPVVTREIVEIFSCEPFFFVFKTMPYHRRKNGDLNVDTKYIHHLGCVFYKGNR